MRNFPPVLLSCLFAAALPATAAAADAAKGKDYFESMNGGLCTSCHKIDGSKLVGPGLAGVADRHTEEWLRMFLSDPKKTWKGDHPETVELKERVGKTRVPVTACRKTPMTSDELDNLIAYLKSLGQ